MKSLSFTFHAFLHGVQGPYCAWHPLQVLVGFVQTFSTFSNLKKKKTCFSVVTVKEMSDWGMWLLGHWLGGKGRWSRGTKKRENRQGRAGWKCCWSLPLPSGKLSILMTNVSRSYFCLRFRHCGYQTFPSPVLMHLCCDCNSLYVHIISQKSSCVAEHRQARAPRPD